MRASVILHIARRFSQSKVQQANGCSQLAVCIHTTDHTTDLVYTGTRSIRMLTDTKQGAISNRSIYICHMQELANYVHRVYHTGHHSEATYDQKRPEITLLSLAELTLKNLGHQ